MKNKTYLIIFIISFLFLTFSLENSGYLYKIPKVGNYLLSVKLSYQADKFSPETVQHKRLKAMSEAFKKNQKTYSYDGSGITAPNK
ncbi:MAG: hypothetical protein WCV58_02450 [Patescibacteria group bacterium]|jgi:hypothetical protein